ncbi:MAG: hypothetical protein FWD39_00120 [Clostridiales bacterium]|nr:hypothetical protein [Clostridiales bacterium]
MEDAKKPKKKKRMIIIIAAVLLLALLFPFPTRYAENKDTPIERRVVRYDAVLYSVTTYPDILPGKCAVKILGVQVFDNLKFTHAFPR